jgi:hypothetical protein
MRHVVDLQHNLISLDDIQPGFPVALIPIFTYRVQISPLKDIDESHVCSPLTLTGLLKAGPRVAKEKDESSSGWAEAAQQLEDVVVAP